MYAFNDLFVTLHTNPEDPHTLHIVFSMGFFVLFWDYVVLQWDSRVWALGFIWCMFVQWDFAVLEVNIYYYMLSGSPRGSRIPTADGTLRFYGGVGWT